MLHKNEINAIAHNLGFDLCGVARVQKLERNAAALDRWLQCGYASTLEYMHRNCDKRFDATNLVDGAQTVVVCAVSYKSSISGGYSPDDNCKIASYACNRDYHKTIKKMLLSMLKQLQALYPDLTGCAFVDSAPIFEKQYAVEAGLGWIGRQSLLITPEYGSYVLLGELVLCDECDDYDQPLTNFDCGECHRCKDACPTSAIVADMTIDTSRCISCHTIEAEHSTSLDTHGWIFGCDECQNACPYNKKAKPHNSASFDPLFDPREITTEEWQAMSEEDFLARFGTTPLKRSGLERIKKNIKKELP